MVSTVHKDYVKYLLELGVNAHRVHLSNDASPPFVNKAVYTTAALFGVLGWAISANDGTVGDFLYTTK